MKEQSLIIIKTDAIDRGLVGEIISRFEQLGFRIEEMKGCSPTKEQIHEHYSHLDKEIIEQIYNYLTFVIVMVVYGSNAIEKCRQIIGKTEGLFAAPGTIRGDFSSSTYKSAEDDNNDGCTAIKNLIHASDSLESFCKEYNIWFKKEKKQCTGS